GIVAGLILGLTIFYLLSPRFDAMVDRQAKLPNVAEAKPAEDARKAAQAKAEDEARKAATAKAEEDARKAAAAAKAEEDVRKAAAAAKAQEDARKAAVAAKAEEDARKAAAAAKAAEDARKAAAAAKAEEGARKAAAAAKAEEDARKAAAAAKAEEDTRKGAAEKVAALKMAPREPAAALACDERQVIAWLDQHGAYNGRLDPSIYDDQVQWIVSAKRPTKTRSEIAKDEEDFRKIYPVQKYTAQTSSTAMDGRHCVLTQQLDSYKRRPNGREEYGTFRVVRTIRTDAEGPRIVAHQIDVLSRR